VDFPVNEIYPSSLHCPQTFLILNLSQQVYLQMSMNAMTQDLRRVAWTLI